MERKRDRLIDQPGFAQKLRDRRRAKTARLLRQRLSRGMLRAPFERLEERHLLATINWDGGGDGTSWQDPLNWDIDTLPSSVDEVVIEDATPHSFLHATLLHPTMTLKEPNAV